MAFPHALRHALAVAVLRRVAAHDMNACREWGHPKGGKWNKDEDCPCAARRSRGPFLREARRWQFTGRHTGCAGVEQAACAAGHRYVKGDVCHEEVECKAFSYECTLCQPGEECDSNYNVETEKGEDYDCKQNLWSGCYFLWPIAWILFYLAIRRVNTLIEEGKQSEAKYVWIKTKWGAVWKSKFFGAFVLILRVNLHAIDAPSARWRGDAGSSSLDGLISTQVAVPLGPVASRPVRRAAQGVPVPARREHKWLKADAGGARLAQYLILVVPRHGREPLF